MEEAVRLHMTHPTVIDWLRQTDAQAVYLGDQGLWRIRLKDGVIDYTEYKDAKGVVYVNQIGVQTDDPEALKRLEALKPEYEQAIRAHHADADAEPPAKSSIR